MSAVIERLWQQIRNLWPPTVVTAVSNLISTGQVGITGYHVLQAIMHSAPGMNASGLDLICHATPQPIASICSFFKSIDGYIWTIDRSLGTSSEFANFDRTNVDRAKLLAPLDTYQTIASPSVNHLQTARYSLCLNGWVPPINIILVFDDQELSSWVGQNTDLDVCANIVIGNRVYVPHSTSIFQQCAKFRSDQYCHVPIAFAKNDNLVCKSSDDYRYRYRRINCQCRTTVENRIRKYMNRGFHIALPFLPDPPRK